ncbi:nuclear transport factor 2 family protein [Kribbella sp. NPDC056345]|uniref:nuclear transport factor 2 family protein n=1 Tax=Kribbella sp. NPDC056345 TaxID=3345789 RepID=UPI0035D5D642
MSEASVREWFERYDALVAAEDFEGMADLALFPLNEVTDDGKGTGSAIQIDRAAYIAQMKEVVGAGEVRFDTTRTPHFLSDDLVFVITDGTMTYVESGQTVPSRYGDLLVKVDGDWKFQTMVQGGWG